MGSTAIWQTGSVACWGTPQKCKKYDPPAGAPVTSGIITIGETPEAQQKKWAETLSSANADIAERLGMHHDLERPSLTLPTISPVGRELRLLLERRQPLNY